MTAYHLTRLTKEYQNRTVLDIPELEIEENRIYALLGPNGAGKTTLLDILGFLDSPTTGEIRYKSRPVRFVESELQALRRDVIMVDQYPILFSTTVFKNVEFGLAIRKIPKKRRARIVEEALDLVGMGSFAPAPAHRLSGGETQRVALARALALSPKVFLCDEPTSSVDVENQAIIVNILKEVNETKHITVVFTTHDRAQAASLAHRTMVLDHGRIVNTGYENVFSCNLQRDDGGDRCFIHPNVFLAMDNLEQTPANGKIRIFIDPDQIRLCTHAEMQTKQNTFSGKVRQIMEENSKIRVTADAGVRITLKMNKTVYRETRIIVGDTVRLFIPPGAIHTLD